MTAPTRSKGTASRAAKAEREGAKRAQGKRAPKEKSSARTRSAASERTYARREERRDRPADGAERRPRNQRQRAEEPQRGKLARPQARVKAKQLQTKVASSRAPLVIAVMSLLGGGLLATLWLSIAAVSGSYELQEAEARTSVLNEQKELLVREVSNMDSTPALERRAKELGLVPGPEPAYLVPNPDGTTTLVGEPEAAKAPPPPKPPAPHGPDPAVQQAPDPQRQAASETAPEAR